MAILKPRSDTSRNTHPREHYVKTKRGWKPKYPYHTEDEALTALSLSHFGPGYRPYLCPICSFYHIGFHKYIPCSQQSSAPSHSSQ